MFLTDNHLKTLINLALLLLHTIVYLFLLRILRCLKWMNNNTIYHLIFKDPLYFWIFKCAHFQWYPTKHTSLHKTPWFSKFSEPISYRYYRIIYFLIFTGFFIPEYSNLPTFSKKPYRTYSSGYKFLIIAC